MLGVSELEVVRLEVLGPELVELRLQVLGILCRVVLALVSRFVVVRDVVSHVREVEVVLLQNWFEVGRSLVLFNICLFLVDCLHLSRIRERNFVASQFDV